MPIADVRSRQTLAGRPVHLLRGERNEVVLKSTPNFSYARRIDQMITIILKIERINGFICL